LHFPSSAAIKIRSVNAQARSIELRRAPEGELVQSVSLDGNV
jgi:hypothetical protein